MAVKIFLSVFLVFCLLIVYSDCSLQGVEASPVSKTFENRLNEIRSRYPLKTSVIEKTLSENQKVGVQGVQILQRESIGLEIPDGVPGNITLILDYPEDWIVGAIRGYVNWYGNAGDIWVLPGPGRNIWAVTLDTSIGVVAVEYDIIVTLLNVVSKNLLLCHEYSR
jgi:hypothetical protein